MTVQTLNDIEQLIRPKILKTFPQLKDVKIDYRWTGNFLLTKNSFLDEINKQYVVTAKAKGLTQRRVLYGHVFRNAMLLVELAVEAGVPAACIRRRLSRM